MKLKGILITLFLHCVFFLHAQEYAFNMNAKLGKGVSLGNAFDLENLSSWDVKNTPYLIKEIKEKGFSHIRIPVSWSKYAINDAPYTIQTKFFDTIQWAVDLALQEKLNVVLTVEGFNELSSNPTENKAKFLGLWNQISNRFELYSDSLYFELLHSPQDALTTELWNSYLQEAITLIRAKHESRIIIVDAADNSSIYALQNLLLPALDTSLIVSFQYFEPFDFTHQQIPLNSDLEHILWDSSSAETSIINSDLNIASAFSNTNNIPIYVNAFGVTNNADSISRLKWISHLSQSFQDLGFSSAYWEFASTFGLYDYSLNCYNTSILTAVIGSGDECDCAKFDTINVKNSDFTRILEPWTFTTNIDAGVQANIDLVNDEAKVSIIQNGGQDWHIQLKLDQLEVQYGSTYRFSFDAYASEATDVLAQITYGLGEPAQDFRDIFALPVTLYSTKKTFSETFVMNEPTSQNMRIVFELGLARAQYLYFDNIHLYEIVEAIPVHNVAIELEQSEDSYLISKYRDSLQLQATALPINAASTKVVWKITKGAELATVSQDGLVKATGVANGIIEVQAVAFDGNGAKDSKTIEISNQETKFTDIGRKVNLIVGNKTFVCDGNTIISAKIYDVQGKSKKLSIKSSIGGYICNGVQLSESLKVIVVTTDTGTYTFKIIQ